MRLTTERLVLRPFTAADASVPAAYRSHPDVARYQGRDTPFPLTPAEAFVREIGGVDPTAPGWFQWAVDVGGVLVGDVGVNLHENRMQADIGYTVAVEHQGHGYATEAVRRVPAHLFDERGLHRVSAECNTRNEPSARLLVRLGFRGEGHRVQNTWIKGEWTDDALFGLLATEWRAHRT